MLILLLFICWWVCKAIFLWVHQGHLKSKNFGKAPPHSIGGWVDQHHVKFNDQLIYLPLHIIRGLSPKGSPLHP